MSKPIMATPSWSPKNLELHYKKHPGGSEKLCWCEILGKPPGAVTIDEYEQRSLKVIYRCWIHFTAGYREATQEVFKKTSYFVDDELCLTAVLDESQAIKTCFHDHPKHSPHILESLAAKTEFLKKWTKKRSAVDSTINIPIVRKLNVESHVRRSLVTYVKEFQAPLRTRGR
jgi:hypothetical protein